MTSPAEPDREGAVHKIIREAFDDIVRPRATGALTPIRFVVAIGQVVHEVTGQTTDLANVARQTLHEFLDDNRVEFGDPRYAWDYEAARTVALEYWIDP